MDNVLECGYIKYNSAESIIKEILDIYSSIKDLSDKEILEDPSNELKPIFQRLDHLVALDIDDESAEKIFNNSKLTPVFDAINRFRNLYTVKIETDHANIILESKDPWKELKNFPFYPNYCQLVRSEYEGSGIKPGDRVVFIGSGPLPLSLIVMCCQHGLKGIGIEQEKDRAELSRRVLEKLGLSNDIHIINGNHFTLPLECGCEIIMLAAQVEPKKEIFDYLSETLPAGTKISYRVYEKGLRRLFDMRALLELPSQLPGEFEEYNRVHPKPPVYNTVVFMIKKSS